jgi:phosphatidate cytidylyltransferase
MSAGAERLWGWSYAFDHPATIWLVAIILGALGIAAAAVLLLQAAGRLKPALRRELWLRTLSWGGIVLALGLPVMAGAFWTVLAVAVIALACYREYARATGLFRERTVSAVTVLGIVLIHLAYMANDWDYRPIILLILICVGLNDVFAFTVGKLLGGPKLLPQTSPNKTVSGALGALVLTTAVTALLAGMVFEGTAMEAWYRRIGLGLIVAVLGQFGDLMLSSVKRDIGIKDMGAVIPGHGGVLDRCNSLLLVAPAVFHYVGYINGFGLEQAKRLFL